MRLHSLYAAVCGLILVFASLVTAQDTFYVGIAVKLTQEGHEKQQADSNYLANLVRQAAGLPPTRPYSASLPTISVGPLIQSTQSRQFLRRAASSGRLDRRNEPLPNFDLWYEIAVPGFNTSDLESPPPPEMTKLIDALYELDTVQSVEALYPAVPPAVNPNDDPRSTWQTYMNAAPDGINARYGWTFPGGDGAGVSVVDVEQGFNFDHEDLVGAGIELISGLNLAHFNHGTAVLGEMFMVDNQIGGIGMITGAKGFAVSQWRTRLLFNTPEAILDAAAHLDPGDIILIEAQTRSPVNDSINWPVEIRDATFEAILTATSQGIIVVEAGANGAHNLDAYRDRNGRAIFNRTSSDFRDSGAIMVGGSTSGVPHRRWFSGLNRDGYYIGSNYGSRIDVYSWAQGITTSWTNETGTDNTMYIDWFGGTSGASPIIVSAAAIVQGISIARHGTKFGPLQMREILSNATHGTPSGNPSADQISVQPDLQKILDNLFPDVHVNDTADVYLRDYVEDTGEETTSSSTRRVLHRSPDIIVRQQPVADPVAAFGPTSGTVTNGALSQDVRVGEEHSLYFRLANRGDREANNVSVSIYWAVPSTLVAPDTWNLIGTVSYPDPVPNDDTLIVSPRLSWPASLSPPEPGHYCFVAIADASPGDAAPPIPDRFDDYERFVQGRNNVVWRNFNAVTAPPSDPEAEGWHKFKILIPGAWDSARVFTLKAHANLPIGSKVRLRVPQDLATPLDIKGCKKSDKRRRQVDGSVVRGIEPQNGEQVLGSGELAAGSKAWVELEVNLPDDAYNQDLSTTPLSDMYSVALSQETGGNEVGRITYVFGKTNI